MANNFISPPFSKSIFPIKVTLGDQSKLTNRRRNSDSSVSGVKQATVADMSYMTDKAHFEASLDGTWLVSPHSPI